MSLTLLRILFSTLIQITAGLSLHLNSHDVFPISVLASSDVA